ncbi:MAG: hypothetical protein GY796_06825 [Chloroflexi bacterium]|nr:hypothetical protein [Chloroflexota bacterium]
MRWKQSLWLLLIFVLAWLPLLLGRSAISSAAGLFYLAEGTSPYFVPSHTALLYVWAPLVSLSACVLLLSPGLFLTLAVNKAKTAGQWIAYGLAVSIVVVSLVASLGQALGGQSLTGGAFSGVLVFTAVLSFIFLLWRARQGKITVTPFDRPNTTALLASILIVSYGLLVLLVPKFYWENFNGDGVHAFEAARLLLHQPLPFWPVGSGGVAGFPGTTSALFVFPTSWFIRLFGEIEAAVRIPYLIFLAGLFGILTAVIEHKRSRPLTLIEISLIWLGLLIYTVAMVYSATYSPYFADIALPATQDTLLTVTFLGMVLAFVQRERPWLISFIGLTYLGSPNGLLVIGFWWLAVLVVFRPVPWRDLTWTAVALVGFFMLSAMLPAILANLNLPIPGGEYGLVGLLRRFAFLQFTDWQRLLYVFIPAGILPALALFAWRWQDQLSRAITLVTGVYFLFFFVQAHISLHHFSFVMALPLIVFWRLEKQLWSSHRKWILTVAAALGLLSLFISLPRNFTPHTTARLMGDHIAYNIPGYDTFDPDAFLSSEMLSYIFPLTWEPAVPESAYGGSPLVWNYYANRKTEQGQENYLLQTAAAPSPPNTTLITAENGFALYVRDKTQWETDLATHLPAPAGSPVYAVPRGILFRSVPMTGGPYILNIVGIVELLGVDMDPILDRLGVERE